MRVRGDAERESERRAENLGALQGALLLANPAASFQPLKNSNAPSALARLELQTHMKALVATGFIPRLESAAPEVSAAVLLVRTPHTHAYHLNPKPSCLDLPQSPEIRRHQFSNIGLQCNISKY